MNSRKVVKMLTWVLSVLVGPALFAVGFPIHQIDWNHISAGLIQTVVIMWVVSFAAVWLVYGTVSAILKKGFGSIIVSVVVVACLWYVSHDFMQRHLTRLFSPVIVVRLKNYSPITVVSHPVFRIILPMICVICCVGAVVAWQFIWRVVRQQKIVLPQGKEGSPIREVRDLNGEQKDKVK